MSEEERETRPCDGSRSARGSTDRPRRREDGDPRTDLQLLTASDLDPDAFGELYRRHVDGVAGYLARRVRDPHVAAELAAETFAQALAGRDRFDPAKGEVRAWIFGIAANLLRRYWRTRRVRRSARHRLGVETTVDQASIDAFGGVIDRLDASGLVELLGELPERQAEAVRLRIVERADYSRICDDLDVSDGAARVLVHRGLKRLAHLHDQRPAG